MADLHGVLCNLQTPQDTTPRVVRRFVLPFCLRPRVFSLQASGIRIALRQEQAKERPERANNQKERWNLERL